MYKNNFNRTQRFLIKIKYTLFLVIFNTVFIPAIAQVNPMVQITEDRPTISNAFKSIEKQTGISFSYDQLFDITKHIELPKTKTALSEIMTAILKDSGRSYVILNNSIAIKPPKIEEISVVTSAQPQVERINVVTQKVEGYVISMNTGQKLYSATINAKSGKTTYVTTTDNQGNFIIEKLAVGSYTFTVSHPDYGTTNLELDVTTEQSDRLVFVLQHAVEKASKQVELVNDRVTQSVDMTTYLQGVDMGAIQKTPRWAIKTNLLADLTTTINIGAEIRLGQNMTVDIPLSINPWTFKGNKKWRHFLVQPELRWWVQETFNKHFVGVNIAYAVYNVGNIDLPLNQFPSLKDYRYEGHLFGGGVSYGYQWILSNRFNLEATLGVGYIYTDYTKKECPTCSDFVEKGSKHYFGPTKAGISLIYIIK